MSSLQTYASNPSAFRADVLIDADAGRVKLGDVLDGWQDKDFRALDGAWLYATGRADHCNGPQRAYLERARGHSKTLDIAIMVVWAIAFSSRQISGIAAAGSRDQARLLRDSIARLIRSNEWLREIISAANYRVKNTRTGSSLEIISADAHTAYGHLVDFILIDEVTNWGDAGEQLWHALFSAAAKRRHCALIIISNAGHGEGHSWQWSVREAARQSPTWYFSRLDGPQASWISTELLEEQKHLLPSQVYRRLWLNEWSTSLGDALTGDDIARAFDADLRPYANMDRAYSDGHHLSVAGLDLSTKRDRSALTVLVGDARTGRIRVARCESWRPGTEGLIPLPIVQDACRKMAVKDFPGTPILYDPYQAELLAQQLRAEGIRCEEQPFTGPACHSMASALLQVFREGRIEIPSDSELESDLARLNIESKQFGYKLSAPRSSDGHCDKAISLAICLPDMAEGVSAAPVHSYELYGGSVGA